MRSEITAMQGGELASNTAGAEDAAAAEEKVDLAEAAVVFLVRGLLAAGLLVVLVGGVLYLLASARMFHRGGRRS